MHWAKTASMAMVTALGFSALLPRVMNYLHARERAALPGDLELKRRTGARDLFKELVGGACSIFKEK